MYALILISASVVLGIVYYLLRRNRRIKGLKNFVLPPGKSMIFPHYDVFENLEEAMPKLVDISKTYGGRIILEILYGFQCLLITDKDFLKLLLGSATILDKDRIYEQTKGWLGTGLLTSGREKWEKTRKIIAPAFHVKVLEKYIENIYSPVATLMEKLSEKADEKSFDIFPYITLCTLDVICETAMGTKINAQQSKDSPYVKSVKEMCGIIQDRNRKVLLFFDTTYRFTEAYQREQKALEVLHAFTKDVIAKKKEDRTQETCEISDEKRLSFLDLIIGAKIDGRPMTEDEIAQEVDTFMFAGHDTTASGTSFTLYCLSTNLEVQKKVVAELEAIFGDDDRNPTYQDIQDMHYLDLVIKESLRLYPPVPIYVRAAKVDTKLGDCIIPKGISIAMFVYGLHRNAKFFPDPEKFIPERFEKEIEPYTYLPFSTGPRSCIGKKFAVFEMKCIISTILRNFQVLPAPGFNPIPVQNIVLGSANGIQLILKKK